MNRHNGSTQSPPNGVAKNVGKLTQDVVSLAELQFELFRSDCRKGLKQVLVPVTLLLVAVIVAVGTVPITLILIAELLAQTTALSRAAAFSIAALSGLLVALTVGVVGWFNLHGVARVLERSLDELSRNMTWIKIALKPPGATESEQPQDR